MREIEVRCCCDAHLIGYLPLFHVPHEGRAYVFPLARVGPGDRCDESLVFTCAPVSLSPVISYLALKSNDYPLAQLRRIDGFREARASEAW